MTRRFRQLLCDAEGVTIVEFALIAPSLMVLLMGLFDLSHTMYTAQMLQGAIQDAARDSTIEGAEGRAETLDEHVNTAVQAIAPEAEVTFERKAYASFSGVNRPEDYNDLNNNGTCDASEPYEDANANGDWDLDPGTAGFGGARDAVLYTVTVTYRRPFPVFAVIPGQSEDFTMVANTVLRNQPFGGEAKQATPAVGNCT